ncbi:MAG: 1,4-dihydroxy-2-naphthoyl-CoA hydrolase, partial [Solirubrobacterales bacterium]|nr:1,4-dihydroxy-2-naphthoyl-CoA hydrolase [Solirubrobacterales bacterium]
IGVEWIDLDPDNARARITVEQKHLQPFGIVHGGVYASLAESICSAATFGVIREDDMVAMGQSNNTTFLRPIASGHVNASAKTRQRGRTTWVWDVELSDDEGRVCALVRMSVAVRPRRD